ncbi:MAG: DUF2752 domain-containing protein [Bacteroidetes bacterium]|nr:DUF2752 domain-containing protein [Bacteroidota bacterium]
MKTVLLNTFKFFRQIPLEAYMWGAALIYLFLIDPYKTQHYSLCMFNNLGIEFCPGCGIGRSIAMIFHGDFIHSFQMHPIGLFALIIISARIYKLFKNRNNHQQKTKGLKWQT